MREVVRNIALTFVVVLACFASVTYVSCKKPADPAGPTTCNGIVCQNGGRCIAGACNCKVGYEGDACDKESMSRYLGKWDVKEKIISSNIPANINKTRVYTLVIRKDGDSKVDMLMDSLMGSSKYMNIGLGLAQRYDETQKEYKPDISTNFAIKKDQKLDNGNMTVVYGNGSVTELGNFISARYTIQYKENNIIVTEVIELEGDFKN